MKNWNDQNQRQMEFAESTVTFAHFFLLLARIVKKWFQSKKNHIIHMHYNISFIIFFIRSFAFFPRERDNFTKCEICLEFLFIRSNQINIFFVSSLSVYATNSSWWTIFCKNVSLPAIFTPLHWGTALMHPCFLFFVCSKLITNFSCSKINRQFEWFWVFYQSSHSLWKIFEIKCKQQKEEMCIRIYGGRKKIELFFKKRHVNIGSFTSSKWEKWWPRYVTYHTWVTFIEYYNFT